MRSRRISTVSSAGPMKKGDNVINFRKFEPVQLGSEVYKLTDKEWPVYVEHIAVREVLLQSLSTERKAARF